MKYRDCRRCGGTGKELDSKAVGEAMRAMRKKHGLSLSDMSKRMKFSTPYLSDIELGNRNWSVELIAKYEAALKQ